MVTQSSFDMGINTPLIGPSGGVLQVPSMLVHEPVSQLRDSQFRRGHELAPEHPLLYTGKSPTGVLIPTRHSFEDSSSGGVGVGNLVAGPAPVNTRGLGLLAFHRDPPSRMVNHLRLLKGRLTRISM